MEANPPQLPQETKQKAAAIRELLAELRASRGFAWFLDEIRKRAETERELGVEENLAERDRTRAVNRYHAFKEIGTFVAEEEQQARATLAIQ